MSYKRWVLVSIALFILGMVLGFYPPKGFEDFISENLGAIEKLSSTLAPFSLVTFFVIVLKNGLALLFSFALSPFLCLVPALTLLLNGSILGFVSLKVIEEESLPVLLGGILPHGIFELPAIIIGLAAALEFGAAAMQAVVMREKRAGLFTSFKQSLRYLFIALALLVPAALIETFITPLFLT